MVPTDVTLSTGYKMPTLGLGVYENDECAEACKIALLNGYRMIDSARFYKNEAQVGEGVRASGVDRAGIFISWFFLIVCATISIFLKSGYTASKVYDPDYGLEKTAAAVNDSIKNLGFSYYDLYLIHSPIGGKDLRLAAYKALLDAKAAGLIHTVGVSNYGIKHMEEIREAGLETPAVNQIELHPLCQQKPIVEYCKKHDIVVQAYTPLIRGATDNAVLQEISKKYNKAPAQILVRWSLQNGFVPLPKSSQELRIISNGQVYDFDIASEDMAKLDALDRGKAGAVTWNPVDAE
ncbi:NADP-dependent oxidoreductase domain-containing protein [Hygrophoropsis aurantiaca]|uniref:NADP-dependent oxidoreductase domain-containing protein n=1 Tax=Hygrophoropsis aurantiaca TaxID=72124 RepID=A0ACB7ZT25_9AGAM|nr:NADP-dependent oxidoreductase domain-containing protein [Hygrophoropsis aurantiaca]